MFLVDDHEVVRRGVRDLLEASDEIEVVGEASTVEEALQRSRALTIDVAVLDVRLPDGSGIDVCRELRSRDEGTRCLMLTSFDDDQALFDAIVAGAAGYVLKEIRGTDLVTSVRRVARGETLLDPLATARVIERLRNPPAEDERMASLSAQERRILTYLADRLGRYGGNNEAERLEVLRWILFDNHKFTSYYATLRWMVGIQKSADPAVVEFLRGRALGAFGIVEKHLATRRFLLGDEPTIADFSLVGYHYFDEESTIDRNAIPNLRAWTRRIADLPGWKHPYELMPRGGDPAGARPRRSGLAGGRATWRWS